MAATTNDAQTQTDQAAATGTPTTAPDTGDLVTGKDAEKAVADFLQNRAVPAGYSIGRDNMSAWVVRKV